MNVKITLFMCERTHRLEILDQIHSATDNTIFYWRIKINVIKSFLSFLSSLSCLQIEYCIRSYLSYRWNKLFTMYSTTTRLRHFNRKIWKKWRSHFTSISSLSFAWKENNVGNYFWPLSIYLYVFCFRSSNTAHHNISHSYRIWWA